MELKTIIIIILVLVATFVIINEILNIKNTIDKQFNSFDNILDRHVDDLKTSLKREINTSVINYKSYTNDMLQQIRMMNDVEKQTIIMSDQFIDEDNSDDEPQNTKIQYLSDMNQSLNQKNKTGEKSDDFEPYMSPASASKESSLRKTINKFTVCIDGEPNKNNLSSNAKNSEKSNCNISNNEDDSDDEMTYDEDDTESSNTCSIHSSTKISSSKKSTNSSTYSNISFGKKQSDNLLAICKYNKSDLIELAKKYDIIDANKMKKTELYDAIKEHIK